jgi:hypothetical protein
MILLSHITADDDSVDRQRHGQSPLSDSRSVAVERVAYNQWKEQIVIDYNPAPVLFRRAMAAAESAKRTASGQGKWSANPRAREADDSVIAIFLAHAAVETAWHWEQAQAKIQGHRWPIDFQSALAAVARARGRPNLKPLDPHLWERALDLNAWRNFSAARR